MKLDVRQPEPVQPPPEYVLTMDRQEAEFLMAAFGKIGGTGAMRRFVNDMHYTLLSEGIKYDPDLLSGSLEVL